MAEERRGRLRAIAAEIPAIAGAALGKRGFGEALLVAQWPAIIGETLAQGVFPEKLSFARGERREGTLHLRVAPGLALEIQDFVKGRIAPYKYPRWIEFVDELPKTATGKIQRFKLRQG